MDDLSAAMVAMLAIVVYVSLVVFLFMFWAWVSSGAWWGLAACMVSFFVMFYVAFCIAGHKQ